MKSRRGTLGTQQQRRDTTKARLIDATVALMGERGVSGFSVTDQAQRAGVSRALAGHHFGSSDALLQAAAAACVAEAEPRGRGLDAMIEWIEDQLARAAAREPKLLATLQIAFGPGADAVEPLRANYWIGARERLQQHLTTAKALGQISADVDPTEMASLVLAILHGEQLRIIATDGSPQPRFVDILKRAVLGAPTHKPARKRPAAKSAPPTLFD